MSETIPTLPPAAFRLLRFWKSARGPHVLPHRTSMDPIPLREWISQLSIIEKREGEKQFFVRVHGSETVENLGQDFSRGYIEDQTSGGATDIAIGPYQAASDALMPVFSTVESTPNAGIFNTLDRLILPFTDVDQNEPDAPVSVDRFLSWLGPTDRVRGEDTAIYRSELPKPETGKNGGNKSLIQTMLIDVDDPRYGLDEPSQPNMPFAAQRPLAKQP